MPGTRTALTRGATGAVLAGVATLLTLVGCASAGGVAKDDQTRNRTARGQGITFREDVLVATNQPLLELLRQRLPGLQIREVPGGCPEVIMRGRSTVSTPSSPAIYLDGARASNDCILRELSTGGLGLVEVYPSGMPTRAGYRTHPYGVIIIFTRGPATAIATGDTLSR